MRTPGPARPTTAPSTDPAPPSATAPPVPVPAPDSPAPEGQPSEAVWDVVVVGGGAAGLAGALMLARSRRRVLVLDAGDPRNAPADAVHALLALDGTPPLELLARGRADVERYGGVVRPARVSEARADGDLFRVTAADGVVVRARRLLLATGLVDELPELPGLREGWGSDVVHCPFCHGWEVRDRAIAVLGTTPMAVHQALMFRQLSDRVRLLTWELALGEEDLARLVARGVEIVPGTPVGVERADGALKGVRMADGSLVEAGALTVQTRMHPRAEPFGPLGLELAENAMGTALAAGPTGATSVPGVWVAGNLADVSAQVGAAAAQGALAGGHINGDLVMADADLAVAAAAA
ncbi:NAD(P)/FAD-dependent oxidoreductase [Georgenia sp. Z1491]|uniref:NAD(P)/FAD-dependent oxidoreductase n=1 Tax=Georgenia sp. Z1491 TaxID=3416707 RepID=UPI003CE78A4C